ILHAAIPFPTQLKHPRLAVSYREAIRPQWIDKNEQTRGLTVPSDIEIARRASLKPIVDIATRLGIPPESVENYGRYKAKISLDYIHSLEGRPDGKLILVTALSPTPAGEGKTTTTVGVGDALNRIGKKAIICLREPS